MSPSPVPQGEQIFYLARPSAANLALFEAWSSSRNQPELFFGDQVDRCFRCHLRQGQTLFIPTGEGGLGDTWAQPLCLKHTPECHLCKGQVPPVSLVPPVPDLKHTPSVTCAKDRPQTPPNVTCGRDRDPQCHLCHLCQTPNTPQCHLCKGQTEAPKHTPSVTSVTCAGDRPQTHPQCHLCKGQTPNTLPVSPGEGLVALGTPPSVFW